MKSMNTSIISLLILTAIVSCTSTPERDSVVQDVRAQYQQLASQAYVQEYAPQRLSEAEQAVARAEDAADENASEDLIDHYVYVAEKRIATAEEAAKFGRAEASIEDAEAERGQVLLDVRETETARARRRAETAEKRAEELDQTLAALESEVESLKTETTDEGIVLTLQDIVFDVNEDELKPGATRTLDRIANFLEDYDDRQLEIKGFTDSTGPATYNQDLSERRAQSVKEALVDRGIAPNRIDTEGMGERFPVASNDTPAGRQQNRRVEILVENPQRGASASGL